MGNRSPESCIAGSAKLKEESLIIAFLRVNDYEHGLVRATDSLFRILQGLNLEDRANVDFGN
jgi:hypothetical protein